MVSAKRAAKWAAGCLILTTIVCGLIYYGPGIWEAIQKAVQGTPGGVPLYPGAESAQVGNIDWDVVWDALLPAGWTGHVYEASADNEVITNWYKTRLTGLNWILENEYIGIDAAGSYVRLTFTKGNDGIMMRIEDGGFSFAFGPKEGIPYVTLIAP